MHASLTRCWAVQAAATAVAAGLVAALWACGGPAGPPAGGFEDLLVRTCSALGMVAVTWLWLGVTATVLEARRGAARVRPPLPHRLRRVVLAACGAGLLVAVVAPAQATPGQVHRDRGSSAVVSGLPLPDRAVAAPDDAAPADALPGHAQLDDAPPGPAPTTRTVTVRAGDTLWGLARDHLGDPERWGELYRANRARIGADPDLIQPATRLRLPADPAEETP